MKSNQPIKEVASCPSYNGCSCPLCPLDQDSLLHGIWYPSSDEEICHLRNPPNWVRTQRKIIKSKAPKDRYFTVAMLKAIKKVHKGIAGVNPDQSLAQAKEVEQRWITNRIQNRGIKPFLDTGVPLSIASETYNLVGTTN